MVQINGRTAPCSATHVNGSLTLLVATSRSCRPCQLQHQLLDRLAARLPTVQYLDVEDQPELAQQYAVTSLPTLLVLQGARVKRVAIGLQSESAVLSLVA
jgi:thiol-disulfide isomerase/thioredoxin